MSSAVDTVDGLSVADDVRYQFREKLRRLLENLAHLDQSGRCSADEPWIFKAAGGFGEVYEAYLVIDGKKVRVALKQMRSYLCTNGDFAKACILFIVACSAFINLCIVSREGDNRME